MWIITLLLFGYKVGKQSITGQANIAQCRSLVLLVGGINKALKHMNFILMLNTEAKQQSADKNN